MPNTGDWLADYPDGTPATGSDLITFQRAGAQLRETLDGVVDALVAPLVQTVTDNLTLEVAARIAGDEDPADALATETAARTAAVLAVSNDIAAEAVARANGEIDEATACKIAGLPIEDLTAEAQAWDLTARGEGPFYAEHG